MKTSPFAQFLCCMAFVLPLAVPGLGLAQDTAAAAEYPLQIRFIDSATGAAIQPESVTSQPHQPGSVERRLANGQVGKNGRAALALERGRHTIAAVAPGYKPMWGDFEMSDNNPYLLRFLLDPLETPRELEPEYVASLHRDGLMLIQGFVMDDDSGALLSGVRVRSVPSGLEVGTDGRGFFQFYVPAPSKAGTKSAPAGLLFEKPGYQSEERLYVELWPGGDCTYRIGLLPGKGTQTVDERQGRRQTSESDPLSAAPSAAATAAAIGELVQPLDNPAPKSTAATNATIRVPRNIRVLQQNGTTIDYVDMGTYARCVLPHEWLASWGGGAGMNCLYAGAVAVRSYAIAKLNAAGSTSTYDICGTSSCQNYDPTVTYSSTDTAANYTANWVMISGGSIASTEYSSENNSLANSCGDGFTEPSTTGPTCIYDPMCYGTARFGHGRGMCQYGSYRWSIAYRGFPARDWTWILRHYYPTLGLVKGAPLMVGDDVKALRGLDVRACTGGTITSGTGCALVTTKSAGTTGTIVGGPSVVTSDGYGFTWYQVRWSDSTVGWSVENYLERVYSAPAAPTSLTATALGTNQINLSWTDASGGVAASFNLERAIASGGPWLQLTTLAASVTNYSDLNLYPGSTRYYRVRAYNAAGYSGYSSIASATIPISPPVMATIPDRTILETTTLCFTNSATAPDLVQLITDFKPFMSETANGLVMFRNPRYSSITSANLGAPTSATLLTVTPDIAALTDACPSGHGTGCVLRVSCQVTNPNNPWLLLTTASTATFPNPVIDFTKQLRFDIYSDQAIKVGLGCRETSVPAGTAIGSDGGTAGGLEWVGVTNNAGPAPMPTRTVAAGTWTTLTFNLPKEPVRNFSGGNGVLYTASGLGVLEHLAIVPAAGTGVYNVYLDNFVVVAPRTFTYSLRWDAPPGASITTNGVFTWTPTEDQGPDAIRIAVIVTDNSSPPLTATNTFVVRVNESNSPPVLASIGNRTVHAGATVTFTNSATDTDIPANILAYSLDPGAPADAGIDPVTGVFTWTTTNAPPNTTNAITVRVTDDGTPRLSDAKTFTTTILPKPTIQTISVSKTNVTLAWNAIPNTPYQVKYKNSLSDAIWQPLGPPVTATNSLATVVDPSFGTVPQRFYCLQVGN